MSATPARGEGFVLDAGDERVVRWMKRAIIAALVAGLLAFVVEGADGPADPSFEGAGRTAAQVAGR